MSKGRYEMMRTSNGKWSVIDTETDHVAKLQDSYLRDLDIDEAEAAAALMNRIHAAGLNVTPQ
ncbi:hypothetical protein WKW50_07440 [Ochrobactrum sp. GPK 3]|uniref:hypothetical protein n=1 Tax=Brucella/Ochrobactrum group TaxID=2826938 RepID=UPI000993F70B|nr:hypothetical protein [Ochrobactrum sp. P6BSIII]